MQNLKTYPETRDIKMNKEHYSCYGKLCISLYNNMKLQVRDQITYGAKVVKTIGDFAGL